MGTAVFILVTQLLLLAASSGDIYRVYSLSPSPTIDVVLHWDLDTARGFEEIRWFDGSPELVLRRGAIGTPNITFTSFEKNETIPITLWRYGGIPPYNKGRGK